MIRPLLILSAFVSTLFFPWPFTVLLTLAAAMLEPLVPLAIGLFADILYYLPGAHAYPLATLCGALVTSITFFVRSRLSTGRII